MDYSKIARDEKRWFNWIFYKHDHFKDDIWVNKEILGKK